MNTADNSKFNPIIHEESQVELYGHEHVDFSPSIPGLSNNLEEAKMAEEGFRAGQPDEITAEEMNKIE